MILPCFFRTTSFFICLFICFNSFNSARLNSSPFPTVQARPPGVADPDFSNISSKDAPAPPILSMYSSNHSKCLQVRRS